MRRFLAAVLVGLLGLGPLPAAAQTIQSAVPSTVSATRSATPVSSPRRASGYDPSLIVLDFASGYFQDGKGNVAAGSPASLSGWSFTGGPSTAPDATGNLSLYREAITNWAFPSTIPGTVPGGNDKWNNNFNGGTSVFVANDRAAPNGTITATKVTTPTTGYDGPYFRSTHIPAANENWTIQAWVYSAAGANFQLNALGSGGTSFTSTASQTFTVPAATWTLLSMQRTGVASPTASSVTAAVLVNGPDTFWVGPVFFGPSNTINVPDVPTTSAAVTRPADVPITNLGLQVWEGRQNLVKNSTMQGSNGSNLPTGWTFQPGAGLTQSIVGKGVEYGLDYIDWSITGTASGTVFPAIYVTGTNASGIAVTNGQPVSASFYYRLVAGALPGGSMAAGTVLFDSGGTYLGGLSTGTSAGTAFGRLTTSATIANASAAYTAFYVAPATPAGITNGTVVNAVIRIYAPQVELATTPGPYLPTTSGAVTKAADAAAITGLSFPPGDFIHYVELTPATVTTGKFPFGIDYNDGTTNNRFNIYGSSAAIVALTVAGGANQQLRSYSGLVAGTKIKAAIVASGTTLYFVVGGVLRFTDTGTTRPTGINRLDITGADFTLSRAQLIPGGNLAQALAMTQ